MRRKMTALILALTAVAGFSIASAPPAAADLQCPIWLASDHGAKARAFNNIGCYNYQNRAKFDLYGNSSYTVYGGYGYWSTGAGTWVTDSPSVPNGATVTGSYVRAKSLDTNTYKYYIRSH